MVNKVILIGRANVGKTTIKQVLFEGSDPNDLIINPLEPTRGIISSIYTWMDLRLSLFDTSGQELPLLLENEDDHRLAFDSTDAVIYVIDYPIWSTQSLEVVEEIQNIFKFIEENYKQSKFYIFFHKIDLINQKYKGNFDIINNQLVNRLNLPIDLKIFFTSINPELIYNTYNAFSEIFGNFSPEIAILKNNLDKAIAIFPKTIGFIIDDNDHIVVQTKTNDFDSKLIYILQEKISKFGELLEVKKDDIFLLDIGSKILFMHFKNLDISNYPNLKNVILFAEVPSSIQVTEMIDKLKIKLKNIYDLK
jgi:GTPase SAR1 family protein